MRRTSILAPLLTLPLVPELSTSTRLADRRSLVVGDRLYAMGAEDGSYPATGFHTRGEMGGLWTLPIKLLDGIWFRARGIWPPAERSTNGWGYPRMALGTHRGVRITGDRLLQRSVRWIKQNLAQSVQEARGLRVRVPDHPWLFGTDGEYSAVAAGAKVRRPGRPDGPLASVRHARKVVAKRETPCFTGKYGLFPTGTGATTAGRWQRRPDLRPGHLHGGLGAVRAHAEQRDHGGRGGGPRPEIAPSPDSGSNIDKLFTERSMVLHARGAYGVLWPVVRQSGTRRLTVGAMLPRGARVESVRLDGRRVQHRVVSTARGRQELVYAGSTRGATRLTVRLR